ncbi:MAG: response regulator [bacterium]
MSEKIRILLVDDEVKFLNSLARRLEMRGFEVFRAENGQEAVEIAQKNRLDLALLDLKMSGMHGRDVLKSLKKEQEELEVIILTGYGSIQFAEECAELGAFCFLPKPYELEDLLRVMKDAYKTRLKKAYAPNQKRIEEIEKLDDGSSALEILKAFRELGDTED